MRIITNKYFKKELPPDLVNWHDDIMCFMSLPVVLQYNDSESKQAWIKAMSLSSEPFPIGKHGDGKNYIALTGTLTPPKASKKII